MTIKNISFDREYQKWVVRFEHCGDIYETVDKRLGDALRLMWRMIWPA